MSNKAWIEKRKNVVLMVRIFLAVSIVLLLLDLVIHRHDLFSWEGWFGFYGFYGFVACVALVLAAFLALSNWNERELVGDDASLLEAVFVAVPATAEAVYVMDM